MVWEIRYADGLSYLLSGNLILFYLTRKGTQQMVGDNPMIEMTKIGRFESGEYIKIIIPKKVMCGWCVILYCNWIAWHGTAYCPNSSPEC